MRMRRRGVLGLGAAPGTAWAVRAHAQPSARVVRFIPAADLTVLDPLLTTTYTGARLCCTDRRCSRNAS